MGESKRATSTTSTEEKYSERITAQVKWIKIVNKPNDATKRTAYVETESSTAPFVFFDLTNATRAWAHTIVTRLVANPTANITFELDTSMPNDTSIDFQYDDRFIPQMGNPEPLAWSGLVPIPNSHVRIKDVA